MTNLKSIGEQVDETIYTLPPWTNLSDFVGEFQIIWRKLGEKIQQQLVQAKIEQTEAQYRGARTKREKRYYTPLGEMVIKRRAYSTPSGIEVKVDQELGLPSGKWLPQVLELASALGVRRQVLKNCHQFKAKKKELSEAISSLERYLTNNHTRIDYQRYLKEGLMIGSGVVESSNRRVVTQRLKQAGMHWSWKGAEGVMALRAAYLSSSTRWSSFWSDNSRVS